MEPILEVEDLCKRFPGFALQEVTFSMPRGAIMGFIGPNGAGKTTTIKLILNLLHKDAGRVRVFGLDSVEREAEIKSRIGFVHEEPRFHEYLTLKQIKSMIAPFYRDWDDSAFARLSGEFELPLDRRFSRLSRGTKMKFAIVLALSHRAELILMDEPTSGLDPVFRREFLDSLLAVLQDERKSILFSSHITSDLERIADYITFIQNGRIIFADAKDTVLQNWAMVRAGLDLLTEENRGLFLGIRTSSVGFEALTRNPDTVRRRFGSKAVVERATLEDVVYYSTKGDHHA